MVILDYITIIAPFESILTQQLALKNKSDYVSPLLRTFQWLFIPFGEKELESAQWTLRPSVT